MKNLVSPEVIASFNKNPHSIEEIADFLEANSDVSTSFLCNLLKIPPKKLYDYQYAKRKSKMHKQGKLMVEPKGATKKQKRYAAEEKLHILEEYGPANNDDKSAILRTYGLYKQDIDRWSESVRNASLEALGKRKIRFDKKSDDQLKIETLEKELAEQEKATAKLSSLILLQKNVMDVLKKS